MKPPAEKQDLRLMREMFSTIAPRYDFVTRTFSYGMDRRWKRLGGGNAPLGGDAPVLDLAAGTGDFPRGELLRLPRARTVAVDMTEAMLRTVRARDLAETVCADATALPFPDATFDCVLIGYGLRHFRDPVAG